MCQYVYFSDLSDLNLTFFHHQRLGMAVFSDLEIVTRPCDKHMWMRRKYASVPVRMAGPPRRAEKAGQL